jgi:hypothetical protein
LLLAGYWSSTLRGFEPYSRRPFYARVGRHHAAYVALLLFGFAPWAQAWQEVQIYGDRASVTVERDGTAIIRHDLQVRIRGGPVQNLTLDGLGTDVEILPDAQVRLARFPDATWPLQVTVKPDGNATMKIVSERGLRGGNYLVGLSYRVHFEPGDEIEHGSEKTRITWIGPRFSSGIDSAQVTMSVPRGSLEPSIPEAPGVGHPSPLLSQVRRGERDEIDLVRTHVARGEPAIWAVEVGRDALDGAPSSAETPSVAAPRRSGQSIWTLAHAIGAGWALLLSLLTYGKARTLGRVTARLGLQSWSLFGGSPGVKAFVSLVLGGAAGWLALTYRPTLGAVFSVLAAANTVFLFPSRQNSVRGPGQWHLVPAGTTLRKTRLEGGLFDVGRLPGFALFALIGATFAFLGYRELEVSAYRAFLFIGASVLFVPLFFTGRAVDFPEAPLTQGRRWLSFLSRRLRGGKVRELELWGRYPLRAVDLENSEVDETRIRVRLPRRPPGLLSLEVAFEEGGGRFVVPCVLVRADEGSAIYHSLASEGVWMRAPSPDERILVVRPSLPTPAQVLALLERLVSKMDAASSDSDEPKSDLKSVGKGEMTRKVGSLSQAI